jgi:outer membrane protein assembly factor BamB
MLLTLCCSVSWATDQWPRFRGPDGSATSDETGLPTTWSDSENIAWKTAMPGPGTSSPIVSGDRVYLTCYSGYGVDPSKPGEQEKLTRHLVCVNLADGKILWQSPVPATLPEDPYQGQINQHGYASSTPATDGERVFVFFGKSGVLAFDRDGKQLWQTSVGTGSAIMGWGTAASPVLYGDLVIVNANAESESIVALDKATGRQVWKTEAQGYSGSWSTPLLVDLPGGKQDLVVFLPGEVWGMDPKDGSLLWFCSGVQGSATSSPVAKDGVIYIVGGGPQGRGSTAIRAGGSGDVSKSHVVWKQSASSYVPSPVVTGGHLYWVDDRGIASCLKADTGEEVYRERLSDARNVYASAVAADGKLYVPTRRNGTFVLAAAPEFKVLAHNRFESDTTDFNASPAVVNGSLLLRSNQALYCIRAQNQ